jgi:hypothetical protein
MRRSRRCPTRCRARLGLIFAELRRRLWLLLLRIGSHSKVGRRLWTAYRIGNTLLVADGETCYLTDHVRDARFLVVRARGWRLMRLIGGLWVTALRGVMREPATTTPAIPPVTTARRIAVPKLNPHGPPIVDTVVLLWVYE